jgi:hypothetical protein
MWVEATESSRISSTLDDALAPSLQTWTTSAASDAEAMQKLQVAIRIFI